MELRFKTALTDKQVPVLISAYLKGYMSFRYTKFQPVQFQLMSFQPVTLSTLCNFNHMQFQQLENSTYFN